jgi:hypothetical protein
LVSEVPIPDPGCSASSDWRPFALKYQNGKLFVGGTCSAESTQNPDDLRGIVYTYENGVFTKIIDIALNYTRGRTYGLCKNNIPWVTTFNQLVNAVDFSFRCGPQPMVSDIEFDNLGNLVLAVADRTGYQMGGSEYGTDPTSTAQYNSPAGGDILKFYLNNGQYIVESNATVGYYTSAGANNNQGINGGEYFYEDNLGDVHQETALGGLAMHPSYDYTIATVIDVTGFLRNGWKRLNNRTGESESGYDILNNGFGGYSKAAGLGDLELLPASSLPNGILGLQVGNYIWEDSDFDGVQDPGELPIEGVKVNLYKKQGGAFTFISSTTSDANGNYSFSNLLADMDYAVVLGDSVDYNNGALEVGESVYKLTTLNSTSNNGNDENDSDGVVSSDFGGRYAICFSTGGPGENNFSLDFGLNVPGLGNLVWKDDNFNGRQDAGEPGVEGVVVTVHTCVNNEPASALAGFSDTTNTTGNYIFQNLPAGTYSLKFDFTDLPNAADLYFSIPNIEGNSEEENDSDVTYTLPGNTMEFTGCFVWSGDSTLADVSFDAGIVCDKDFDGIPDGLDGDDTIIDPLGYLYCEHTGEILDGGLVSITGPAGSTVYLVQNGSNGYYQFFVDQTGEYVISVTNPSGFASSITCLDGGYLDAPDSLMLNNPYIVGSGDADTDDFLDVYTCPQNRFYTTIYLEPGDFIVNNNFPYSCQDWGDLPSPYPTVDAEDGARHGVLQTPTLFMGTTVDIEDNGAPETCAGETTGGDDFTGTDDEDGVVDMPDFIITQPVSLPVSVTNTSGASAKLIGFVDFNADGDFADAAEMAMVTVPDGSTNVEFTLAFTVPDTAVVGQKVGLRLRLSSDTSIDPTGLERFGEVEDYMITVIGFDFGDLPDTYNTSGSDNPPAHIVTEDLKLGSSVDAELDGIADPMAGLMGGGDDGDPGLATFGTSTPAGDDENGVMLASPMVPGATSSFMVDAMNMTSSAAVLQAWVDFNGNGTFEANEQLTSGSFAPSGAVVPVGGLSGAKLTFEVPSDATFYQGNAMVRFRLSPDGGLAADAQIGTPPFGEIEDYKFPLAKIGNIVFEDRDFDGTQDAGEPGIDGVNVMVTWAGANGTIGDSDDVMYQTTTGPSSNQSSGEYYVCGLINGTYKVKFTTPANMTPTRSNIGGQTNGSTVDSDGAITGMDLSMAMETFTIADVTNLPTNENGLGDSAPAAVGTFPDAQTDETHDQGFAFLDYGDLPESGNGDAFNTTMAENGAVHVIIPGLKLGASVDGEQNGIGSATATGDDNNNTGSVDDEDGISFVTPLIPGYSATVSVSAMNMTGSNAVLQGWIDWNNNGLLDGSEALAFTNGGIVPNGGVSNAGYTFPVPASAIFNDGMVFARFRLSPTGGQSADGPDKYNAGTTVPQGEVEDYKLNVGKMVSKMARSLVLAE